MRPIHATVSLSALRANITRLRQTAPDSRLWGVVKADAYGHGLSRMLPALDAVDGLALLELDAAVMLRERGWRKPVLLLEGLFESAELEVATQHGLTCVVHAEHQVAMLEKARVATPLPVHLKFNSGMNRLGFDAAGVHAALARLRGCANVADITLMTHFADADAPEGVAAALTRFRAVAAGTGLPACIANSAAMLRFPETRLDWVRPGIALYGCTPFADQSASELGLAPVMTLHSRLISVRELAAGDRVGYGGTYTAARPMRVGVVACGYADGYPRHAPGLAGRGTPVLVEGRRTRIVGRPSMDMLIVDLEGIPQACAGSPVTLWGEGLSADEVAAAAGTVSYEMLCALAPRVPVDVIDGSGR